MVLATGAVSTTKAVRLTDLPVDEFTKDFSSLPGPFTDGKIPLGFVAFEPEGVTFSAPVTWTIEYTGSLPVGSQLACYYWIEAEARWGNPVPSVVVDLGNGKNGLRAVLPHFSIYGHGAPPVLAAPPPPPPNPQPDPQNNPNQPDNGCPAGSQINLMTGDLCQTVGTLGLPTIGNLTAQITS